MNLTGGSGLQTHITNQQRKWAFNIYMKYIFALKNKLNMFFLTFHEGKVHYRKCLTIFHQKIIIPKVKSYLPT